MTPGETPSLQVDAGSEEADGVEVATCALHRQANTDAKKNSKAAIKIGLLLGRIMIRAF